CRVAAGRILSFALGAGPVSLARFPATAGTGISMSGSVSVPAGSMPKVLRRIFTFVWPHCGVLVAALVCLVLTMGCELAGPYLLGGAIDSLLAAAKPGGAPQPLSRDVVEYGVAFLAVGLSGQAFNFGKEILRTRLSTQVLSDIRV